jgi:hypothetical protein
VAKQQFFLACLFFWWNIWWYPCRSEIYWYEGIRSRRMKLFCEMCNKNSKNNFKCSRIVIYVAAQWKEKPHPRRLLSYVNIIKIPTVWRRFQYY